MPKKAIVGVIAALLFVAAAMAMMMTRGEKEWTTTSDRAAQEFKAGLAAEMKLYHPEAREHYERALRDDPDFAMARLKLVMLKGDRDVENLKKELLDIDVRKLTSRERFLIEYVRREVANQRPESKKILDAFLEKNPKDSVALNFRCEQFWVTRDWAGAERCYSALIATDPNWVIAQNHLGYIAMAQGKFDLAEERFLTYRYIAPDQANPHDSLAELLMLRGRYEEARQSMEKAISIRPDFCASWEHLVQLELVRDQPAKAKEVLDRARKAGSCTDKFYAEQECRIAVWERSGSDWSSAMQVARDRGCIGKGGDATVIMHRAAIESGDEEEASRIEKAISEVAERYPGPRNSAGPVLLHMEGVRLIHQSEPEAAAAKLREVDARLVYWGDGQGIFKLYNALALAKALDQSGKPDEARAVRARVKAVNPQFAKSFERFL